MGVDFGCDRFGDHRLTCAGRAVKQNTFRGVNTEPSEQLWVFEGKFNHFTDFLQLLTDTTDVFVGDAFGLADVFLCNGLVLDDDFSIGVDDHDAFGDRLHNGKGQRFGEERHAWNENPVARHDRALG